MRVGLHVRSMRVYVPLLLVLFGASNVTCTAEREKLPDIVVYLVDTLRADHLGIYGYERETSPRLDAFAKDAMIFDRAYSTSSWTKPATASLLTGLAPARHGANSRSDALDARAVTLATLLKSRGYHTVAFVTNPNVLPAWGFDRGFDKFFDIESVARSARADRVGELVMQYLEKAPDGPRFLYIHTRDPHGPYDPPAPYDQRFSGGDEIAGYDGEIAFSDFHFGELLDRLRAMGRYDESAIVFLSDHGEEFEEHGNTGHGKTLYEELVRIPLLLKLPGRRGRGQRCAAPIQIIDVVPTLLTLVDLDSPEEVEGQDLASIDCTSEAALARPLFFDLDQISVSGRLIMSGVLKGSQKLVWVEEPESETLLFDLALDPHEHDNRAHQANGGYEQLQELLLDRRSEARGGVQLWLVNDGESSNSRAREISGHLSTEGRFVAFRVSQLEEADHFTLDDASQNLRFRVKLRNRNNPIGQKPSRLVDVDTVSFRIDPPDATLKIESLQAEGEKIAVFLGAGLQRAGPLPLLIHPGEERLRVALMGALLPSSRELSIVAPGGVYLGVVAPRGQVVEVSPNMDARLRALGYVE
jgi:arylsulfatase A-like enzyme